MLQGFLGFGNFVGGTLRLAIPSIVLGFLLGIFIGIGRLAPRGGSACRRRSTSSSSAACPLVMVIFWMWFFIPIVLEDVHSRSSGWR